VTSPCAGKPRGNPEDQLAEAILAECGWLPGVLLLRNVVKTVPSPWGPGFLEFGLGTGTPDLVGSVFVEFERPITLADGSVWQGTARFIALELKVPGKKAKKHQAALHAAWRKLGVFVASEVTSVDQARAAIERARRGELS